MHAHNEFYQLGYGKDEHWLMWIIVFAHTYSTGLLQGYIQVHNVMYFTYFKNIYLIVFFRVETSELDPDFAFILSPKSGPGSY